MPRDEWLDTFYQYRIPIVADAMQPGRQQVPVTPEQLTEAINRTEEMAFQPLFFDYNHLEIVQVDPAGHVLAERPDAGFHLITEGPELIDPERIGTQDTVEVPVEDGAYYLLRYSAEGAGIAPSHRFRPIFPIGHKLREYAYYVSHEPRMLPKALTDREQLILTDGTPMKLDLGGRWIKGLKAISLKRASIAFLADIDRPGRTYWMAYYQPNNGHHLTVPKLRCSAIPSQAMRIQQIGTAEKHLGDTRYRLLSHKRFTAWFAETSVKLTPDTPVPEESRPAIRITAAANEAQSFQLVLRPSGSFRFRDIQASALTGDRSSIDADHVSFYQVNYIPIVEPSYISPVRYTGMMADPLTEVTAAQVSPGEGNFALLVTVRVPADTPAGLYHGALRLTLDRSEAVDIPLDLEVYDFELPEFSPFRTSFGAPIVKATYPGEKTVADYHGISDKQDIRKLAHAYYDVMAANKFTPKSVHMFSEIGMSWTPPPDGFNADTPDNYFRLHDWDFSKLNQDLQHYIDELKVNAVGLVHTNPSVITMFKHLPGKPLDEYERRPPHVSMAWQFFQEATHVGYDKREEDTYQEITRDQFNHLVLDFYRALAKNLNSHGWLDYAYIMVDETAYRGYGVYLDFIRLLKSDPLTAHIKFAWCIQGPNAFNHKEDPDDEEYAFNNLLDIYVPETNENNHYWEKYYFTDYDVQPSRDKLWNYVTYTTRSAIDTPGVNNRATALEVFNNGGGGFLNWGSFIWDSRVHAEMHTDNPWQSPYTRWSNGALSYFYPPRKDGPTEEPDFTIVPSLRIMTYREGVDDYEYAYMLEQLIQDAEAEGVDTSQARSVLADIERFFFSTVHWSQNDAWYLDLRDRMARQIGHLRKMLNPNVQTLE